MLRLKSQISAANQEYVVKQIQTDTGLRTVSSQPYVSSLRISSLSTLSQAGLLY